ncbi:serine/threonine-protein kinase [Streptomyces sp. NPDC053431]|uniref:serine/threonine-protein kinase n=1 Tax=Streptomyces sp. NPDC053431 TaxID=3365703 RepID=UPI0037D777A5
MVEAAELASTPGEAWLVLIGAALVVRLATLPLLLRTQRAFRQREAAAFTGGGPSGADWTAPFVERALTVALCVGLLAFLANVDEPIDFEQLSMAQWPDNPLDLGSLFGEIAGAHAYLTQDASVTASVFAVLGVVLWFLTRQSLLTAGMPTGLWAAQRTRVRVIAGFVLYVVLLVVVLPVGVTAVALVCQVVALVAARRQQPLVSEAGGSPPSVDASGSPSGVAFAAPSGEAAGRAAAAGPDTGPSASGEPSASPEPSASARPTASAEPTAGPKPSGEEPTGATPTPAPAPPPTPTPTPTPAPTPAPPPAAEAAASAVPGPRDVARRGPAAAADSAPADSAPAVQELYPHEPRTIGTYRLLGRIGSGGMGTVYLARRDGSATQVALKTIHAELLGNAELLGRFEREAEVLSMVSGAYTARVLDSGVDAGRPYLAMELLDGRPLDAHLRELGPLGGAPALRALALALAAALSAVHRLGLVHRDLKPGNIMLTSAGPRLLDFGIATIVDRTRLTAAGGGPGTLTYMAPEQFEDGPVGPAADIWAWGCCVVCAVHGDSPFAATGIGAAYRKITETGPEPAALAAVERIDPGLAAVVRRALSPRAQDRPADGAALVALLTEGPGSTVPDGRSLHDQVTQGWRTVRSRLAP